MEPGVGIVKVRSGLVEIILRFFITLLSIGVLIISSITLNHVEDKFISSISDTLNEIGKNLIGVDYNQLYQYSVVGSGIIIGLTSALILYEVLVIITRFVNINIINKKINVFVIVDVIMSFLFGVLMGLVSTIVAYAASQWSKVNDNTFIERLRSVGIVITLKEVAKARDLLSAMAGLGFGESIILAGLLLWMVIVFARNCNSLSRKLYKNLN